MGPLRALSRAISGLAGGWRCQFSIDCDQPGMKVSLRRTGRPVLPVLPPATPAPTQPPAAANAGQVRSQQEPTAASSAATAANSDVLCDARGDSSGQIAEPGTQVEGWRQSGGSIKLTVNASETAVEQMPGYSTAAPSESAAAEGSTGGGQSPPASTSLDAQLVGLACR